jgi:hypothetical protein
MRFTARRMRLQLQEFLVSLVAPRASVRWIDCRRVGKVWPRGDVRVPRPGRGARDFGLDGLARVANVAGSRRARVENPIGDRRIRTPQNSANWSRRLSLL